MFENLLEGWGDFVSSILISHSIDHEIEYNDLLNPPSADWIGVIIRVYGDGFLFEVMIGNKNKFSVIAYPAGMAYPFKANGKFTIKDVGFIISHYLLRVGHSECKFCTHNLNAEFLKMR